MRHSIQKPVLLLSNHHPNFILLEKYADNRKSTEWTGAMEAATQELAVNIVQSTSDEGRGIFAMSKAIWMRIMNKFGNRPREMFEELLNKIDLPGRPACRRS